MRRVDSDHHVSLPILSLPRYSPGFLICLFSLCYLVIKSERSPLRTSFVIGQIVTMIWLLFVIREWVSVTTAELVFNMRVCLICINFAAPTWLITMLFLAKRLSKKYYWIIPVILIVPFVLSAPLLFPVSSDIFKFYIKEIFFDEQARIYFATWGPFESMTGIYAFCCMFLSFCSLLFFFRNNSSIKLIEKIAALLILWAPITAHYIGLIVDVPFDLMPVAFILWGLIIIYLSSHRQLFNAAPSPVWNIFNITRESMAIISVDGSINLNKTFVSTFGPHSDDFMKFMDELSAGLSKSIRQKCDISCLEAKKDGVYYEISIKNLFSRKNKIVGQLITINDISEAKQLTLVTERERIASGLHDNLGNWLIASINTLNLALIKTTPEEIRPLIDSAISSTTASLMMLRKIVEGLSPIDFSDVRLLTLIESIIHRISASGVSAELQISGETDGLPVYLKEFAYNTCQEALTNSVIHSKAENVVIKLECTPETLKLDIVDNGCGCEKIFKNNGLTAMENRVKRLSGKIRFGSPSTGGFGVYTVIPIKAGD